MVLLIQQMYEGRFEILPSKKGVDALTRLSSYLV